MAINHNDLIGLIIDRQDARRAGQYADRLRDRGATYADILASVQRARPNVTAADWDALLYESEAGDDRE